MVGFMVFHSCFNFVPVLWINRIAIASFVWLLGTSAVMIIVLPAVTPKHNTNAFVWTDWIASARPTDENPNFLPALPDDSWTAMCGLLMAQYLLLVYDTPGHMAEETVNPSRNVPRAIIFSYVFGGLLNFGMLLSYMYCVDLDYYQYNIVNFSQLPSPDQKVALGNFLILGVTNGKRAAILSSHFLQSMNCSL